MIKNSALKDALYFILGDALVAVSVSCFTAPNDIAAGGLTGIATLLFYLFKIPVGTSVLLLNIPIFVVAFSKFGSKFLYKSLIATIVMTGMIDLFSVILPVYKGDLLLSSIFGGVLSGLGLAFVFLRGATTGGVDIIAKLTNIKFPHISMGNMIMYLDAFVVISSAIVYQNIESALYSVIVIFVQSKALDYLLYGYDKGRLIIVRTRKFKQISDAISAQIGRVPNIAQSDKDYYRLIFCAVRRIEVSKLHKIIKEIDTSAFIITLEAGEIIGEGFKKINEAT